MPSATVDPFPKSLRAGVGMKGVLKGRVLEEGGGIFGEGVRPASHTDGNCAWQCEPKDVLLTDFFFSYEFFYTATLFATEKKNNNTFTSLIDTRTRSAWSPGPDSRNYPCSCGCVAVRGRWVLAPEHCGREPKGGNTERTRPTIGTEHCGNSSPSLSHPVFTWGREGIIVCMFCSKKFQKI